MDAGVLDMNFANELTLWTSLGLVVHDLGGPVGLHWAVNNRSAFVSS